MARATTTWAHASAPRWGETWARSIKIPRILAILGGTGILPKAALAVPGGPWVWSLGLFSPSFFLHIHKQKKRKKLIKKEYCRCGPHPLQVTSSRVRPPLGKGASHIGCLFPDFRGWSLWFMTSIALRGLQKPAPEAVPGASLHSEALSPECGREHQGTGDGLTCSTCRSRA